MSLTLFQRNLELVDYNLETEEKRRALGIKYTDTLPDEDTEGRTIYVGNVKATTKKKSLQKFFSNYGEVESIRYRGAAPESMNMSKKEAITTGKLHQHRPTIIAFVKFKKTEFKEKALSATGEIFSGLHLTVDAAIIQQKREPFSVFVGNLPWAVQDEDLWTHFGPCGKILKVRIVRSAQTGSSKGFGYIAFKARDAVDAALKLTDSKIGNRPIRVKKTAIKEKIVRVRPNRKPKSGVSALVNLKTARKLKADFLKSDKPQANKIKDRKREDRRKQKHVRKASNTFSGRENSNQKTVKNKKKNRNKFERKNRRVAKILAAKDRAK